MDNQRKISYKEMQELLPDYVFGRASEEDMHLFEFNMQFYPEMQQEVDDTKAVFTRLEKMNWEDKVNEHTRYLSYKVINRMQKSPARTRGFSFMIRFAVPALAIFLAAFIFMSNMKDSKNLPATAANVLPEKHDNSKNKLNIVTDADLATVINDPAISNKDLNRFSADNATTSSISALSSSITNEVNPIDDFITEYITENLVENAKKTHDIISSVPGSAYDLLDQLNELDEEEFQNILEALEDVKISV